jgi:hypothetical protein
MYGSITRLPLKSEASLGPAATALQHLLSETGELDPLCDCYVIQTGPSELTMITIYESEAASTAASDQWRPTLAASVGAHVSRPPERRAGKVLARRSRHA